MPNPSVLLIHGAACGAWVWDAWRRELTALGWQANVLDLRGHGRSMPTDLSIVTIEDYVADVASVTVQIEAAQGVHPILGGWGMGGLVAMAYAAKQPATPGLLLFDAMAPGEVRKADIDTVRRYAGTVLTPETFGIYTGDRERSRDVLFDLDDAELEAYLSRCDGAEESGLAFRQALRGGISIPAEAIACPSLVIAPGASEADMEACRQLGQYLGGECIEVPGMGHWGIVCHGAAVAEIAPQVDGWLCSTLEPLLTGEGEP